MTAKSRRALEEAALKRALEILQQARATLERANEAMRQERTPPAIIPPNPCISIEEISNWLGIGEMAVYQMLRDKQLPGLRIGAGKGRWLVTREAFELWLRTLGELA